MLVIFNAKGEKLDPESYSTCKDCEGTYKLKEMYRAGQICENCHDQEMDND